MASTIDSIIEYLIDLSYRITGSKGGETANTPAGSIALYHNIDGHLIPVRFENSTLTLIDNFAYSVLLTFLLTTIIWGIILSLLLAALWHCDIVRITFCDFNWGKEERVCTRRLCRDRNNNNPPSDPSTDNIARPNTRTTPPDDVTSAECIQEVTNNLVQRKSRMPTTVNIRSNREAHPRPLSQRQPFSQPRLLQNSTATSDTNNQSEVPRTYFSEPSCSRSPRIESSAITETQTSDRIANGPIVGDTPRQVRVEIIDVHTQTPEVPEDVTAGSSSSEYDRYIPNGLNNVTNTLPSRSSDPGNGDHERLPGKHGKPCFTSEEETKTSELQSAVKTPPQDRVILHQYQRGRCGSVPSLSPFAMKLETYLRMTEVEYDIVFDCDASGPWLSYHNEVFKGVVSSMMFLKQTFPSQTEQYSISQDGKTVSWFITVLVEYHLYWALTIWQWVLNEGRDVISNQPNWVNVFPDLNEFITSIQARAQYHGFGKFSCSTSDLKAAILDDLEVLSETLGDKVYLTGNAPKEVDCSAFAVLSQMMWSTTDDFLKNSVRSFPNILRYCEKVKSVLWPDWEDVLSKFNTATFCPSTQVTPLSSPRCSSIRNDDKHHCQFESSIENCTCYETPCQASSSSSGFSGCSKMHCSCGHYKKCIAKFPKIPNCPEEYFDENLEDMESIKMKECVRIRYRCNY